MERVGAENTSKEGIKSMLDMFEDVRILVPWGHIVGRWYGNRQVRPLLALHGYLDNLGTWNNLVPLLLPHTGILCIDLPGHGYSSKLPRGIPYNAVDYACVILRIMQEYGWLKVSILSHSMSSMISFVFVGLYPQRVDMLICIDIVRSRYRHPYSQVEYLRTVIEKFEVEDEHLELAAKMEPPTYTFQQMENLLHDGSYNSVDLVNCKHILERNVQKSTKFPDKYFFTRDGRVKYYVEFTPCSAFVAELAKRMREVPYCVIKGSESQFIDEESDEVIEILRSINPHFEIHEVTGTHHVHLNNAAGVAAILIPFICKHRPPLLKTWATRDDKPLNELAKENILSLQEKRNSKL